MKNSETVRVYGVVPYDRGAKVRWLLTEMDIAYEEHWLDGSIFFLVDFAA